MALKSSGPRRTRFTPAQKSYLTTKFMFGEQNGKKTDPAAVARSMMCAKDSNGSRLSTGEDYLTANQIAGFFPALLQRKKKSNKLISRSLHMKLVGMNL